MSGKLVEVAFHGFGFVNFIHVKCHEGQAVSFTKEGFGPFSIGISKIICVRNSIVSSLRNTHRESTYSTAGNRRICCVRA